MSNTEFVLKSHRVDLDLNDEDTEFPASDVQWAYIMDNNAGNQYPNGWINFSNANLIGNNSDKFFDMKNAYIQVPYGVVVSIAGGSFGKSGNAGTADFVHAPENAFAVAPKSEHQHIIDLVSAKVAGISITRQSQYTNLMMTEDLKCQTADHERMFHENCSLDSAESYRLTTAVLETNNRAVPLNEAIGATGFRAQSLVGGFGGNLFANDTHLKRMLKQNFDNTDGATNLSVFNTGAVAGTVGATLGFAPGSILNNLQTGFMGAYDENGNKVPASGTPIAVSGKAAGASKITKLLFQYVANIPLASICDFYKSCPSLGSLANFELRMQLNISPNNSWSVTYGNTPLPATPYPAQLLVPTSFASNQSVGTTCPFMLSQAVVSNNLVNPFGQGLVINATNAVTPVITCTPFIGYCGAPEGFTSAVPPPSAMNQGTRIWCPQYNFTPAFNKPILDSKNCKVTYKDFYVDTIPNVIVSAAASSVQVSKLFVSNLSHVRNVYIIPFLTGATPVNQSLLSSAPTTCSFCKMSNFQVQIGGVNILTEAISTSNQFYENAYMQALAQFDGNAHNSELISGLVTKSMYQRCYGVVTLDVKRVSDQVQDDAMKSFLLNFRVDSKGTYNFIVIITYDNTIYIDRVLGSVVSPEEASR
jgi:hypothetical protein